MATTSDNNGYNGWTNYETWAVSLWMSNDQGSDEYWRDVALETRNNATANEYTTRDRMAVRNLADQLKEEHQDATPELEGVYADLLSASLSSVNWYEIAERLIEDLEPEEEEEEEEEDEEAQP